MHYPTRSEIEELSPEDRLRLIGDVWETLETASDSLGLPEGHQEVLDQRLAELEKAPDTTLGWDEVLRKVRNRR
jgi:putative addiction module component (TIGR02574 family)